MDETEPLMVGGQDDTANSTPLYEHPDVLQTLADVAGLAGDILGLFATDGVSAITEIQAGSDGIALANDLSSFANVPTQDILDSWSTYQSMGIAPGNVYLSYEDGAWQFDSDLNFYWRYTISN